MEGKDIKPTKGELRQVLGKFGDQDIVTQQKPDPKVFLKELAILKGVSPNIETELLEDVLGNILTNEQLQQEQEKK